MPPRERGTPEWFVASLAKGLRVLRVFSKESPALKASEVARRAGVSRAAARRILLTLVDQGYVGCDGDRYYLRAHVLELGFAYLSSMSFGDLVQPILVELADKFGEASSVAILDGIDTIYIARAPERRPFSIAFTANVGARLPAFATALGRVLLASLPESELEVRLEGLELQALTPYSITDPGVFRAELARVRERGYATTANQIGIGIGAIAAPVVNCRGATCAALNIQRRVPGDTAELDPTPYLPDLFAAARQVAAVVEATNPVASVNPW